MKLFAITVKLPRNPEHNPREKKVGRCPIGSSADDVCTDVTGEHHTYILQTDRLLAAVTEDAKLRWGHVTRVEEVDLV